MGVAFFIIFAIYSLGFWYAGILVARGEMKAGDALAVFFAVVMGAMGLGQASQISPDFDKARGALATIGEVRAIFLSFFFFSSLLVNSFTLEFNLILVVDYEQAAHDEPQHWRQAPRERAGRREVLERRVLLPDSH